MPPPVARRIANVGTRRHALSNRCLAAPFAESNISASVESKGQTSHECAPLHHRGPVQLSLLDFSVKRDDFTRKKKAREQREGPVYDDEFTSAWMPCDVHRPVRGRQHSSLGSNPSVLRMLLGANRVPQRSRLRDTSTGDSTVLRGGFTVRNKKTQHDLSTNVEAPLLSI